jgi:hypothetical protein
MSDRLLLPIQFNLQLSIDPELAQRVPGHLPSFTEAVAHLPEMTGHIAPKPPANPIITLGGPAPPATTDYFWKCEECQAQILLKEDRSGELDLCPLFHHLLGQHQLQLECKALPKVRLPKPKATSHSGSSTSTPHPGPKHSQKSKGGAAEYSGPGSSTKKPQG